MPARQRKLLFSRPPRARPRHGAKSAEVGHVVVIKSVLLRFRTYRGNWQSDLLWKIQTRARMQGAPRVGRVGKSRIRNQPGINNASPTESQVPGIRTEGPVTGVGRIPIGKDVPCDG